MKAKILVMTEKREYVRQVVAMQTTLKILGRLCSECIAENVSDLHIHHDIGANT